MKPVNIVINEDKIRIPNVIFTPSQSENKIVYEQKVIYHPTSKPEFQIPLAVNTASQIGKNPMLQTQLVQVDRRRDSSLKKYERKMSQHKIDPSEKIKIEGEIEMKRRGQSVQRGKKKFINLVSNNLL